MFLSNLIIGNYKSFFEKTFLKFEPGFNILIGANSSGKTSVLQAIKFLEIERIPHRSIKNIKEIDTPWNDSPEINAIFEMSISQAEKIAPVQGMTIILDREDGRRIAESIDLEKYWKKNKLKIEFLYNHGTGTTARVFPLGVQARWRGKFSAGGMVQWRALLQPGGTVFYANQTPVTSDNLGDVETFVGNLQRLIYRFSAERIVMPSFGFSTSELNSNASNLAFCINHLMSDNAVAFEKLNHYINRIFPTVHRVSAVPGGNQQFNLKVQTLPQKLERSDLAVPIDQVGTGVSNAVAMLYVVLTSHTSKIILLEEPNSYLHPRALKELLSILSEVGSKHQFFITTHSSDVLRNIKASTVTLLKNDGTSTTVEQTTQNNLEAFQEGLLDLGIRLTDLHGCDRVLWVEGETEEAIFPKIIEHFFPEIAQGVATLRLHATGDFESRKIKPGKVAEIYKRLSQSTFLAPPMVAITLDREGKQQSQVESMIKECGDIVYLLPKPMTENYLIKSPAIVWVLKNEFDLEVTELDVDSVIAAAKLNQSNRLSPISKEVENYHAAKVLSEVFNTLCPPGVEYNKARHGPMLADWILANNPSSFDELRDWMNGFLFFKK